MLDVYVNIKPPSRDTHSLVEAKDRYIEIIPYSRNSDNQRVQKVLDKLGGVKSWKAKSGGKLTVSTIQPSKTIINALKHEFSSNRSITLLKKTDVVVVVSSKPPVVSSHQDKALLQGLGTIVAAHASQGLIKNIEYKETTTKNGTKTKAIKVNYDAGTSRAAVPRVHNHTSTHPTSSSRRVRFANAS